MIIQLHCVENISCYVDRASRYKFLVITHLTHFFMYLFISCLYMFRPSQRSSSGGRNVLIHHLVWLVCVSDCLVCRSGGKCSSLLTGIFHVCCTDTHTSTIMTVNGIQWYWRITLYAPAFLSVCINIGLMMAYSGRNWLPTFETMK